MYCKAGIELNRAHLIGPAAGRAHECLLWLCAGALIGREGDRPAQSLSRVNRIRQCLPLPLPVPKSPPMTTQPILELPAPARDVFHLCCDAWAGTGQPAGPRTRSNLATITLSHASIRHGMQNLGASRLLSSPPTPLGRIRALPGHTPL